MWNRGRNRGARDGSLPYDKTDTDTYVHPGHKVMFWLTDTTKPPSAAPNWGVDDGPSLPIADSGPSDDEADRSAERRHRPPLPREPPPGRHLIRAARGTRRSRSASRASADQAERSLGRPDPAPRRRRKGAGKGSSKGKGKGTSKHKANRKGKPEPRGPGRRQQVEHHRLHAAGQRPI